ncbi:MAG TPA: tetratricopeptide repeat protein, partial [Alphaproteobacteria bacterium]|nr:tetratricopeptide repeat protein [Alphaproteobacteria bacterium]
MPAENEILHRALGTAFAAFERGDSATAGRLCREVLGIHPRQPDALQLLGVIAAQGGRLDEAEAALRQALAVDPRVAFAHFNLGNVLYEQGRHDEALASYTSAVDSEPSFTAAALQRNVVLTLLGRAAEAIAGLDALVGTSPSAEAFYHRGNALKRLGRLEAALADYDRALTFRADDPETLYNRGNALLELARYDEAVTSYDRALAAAPDYLDTLNNRGIALLNLGRADGALADFERATGLDPQYAPSHYNRGNALKELGRSDAALAAYDAALALDPRYAAAANNRGSVLVALRRIGEAVASFDRALDANPAYADALCNRGQAQLESGDYARAAVDFERLQRMQAEGQAPDFPYMAGDLIHARMHCCDWRDFDRATTAVIAGVRAGERVCDPFAFVAFSDSSEDHRRCAEIVARDRFPAQPMASAPRRDGPKIRLGYVSGEFCEQATAFLIAGLIERHDKARFEVHGFDNGIDDGSNTRRRLVTAFDSMTDIARLSDADAANAVRERGIDILINLNGYFGWGRNGVFACRPAPVQVNYLGFPGTLGGDLVDYIIADRHVLPASDRAHFSESVVTLPECYQPNDSKRALPESQPTRADAGLPEQSFVFCSFNNNYKLTPEMFDRWMRILGHVDGSVLWLLEGNDAVAGNLRREAAARGIDPARMVFAPRVPPIDHLARHRLADLFLDTLPYNAHTTASDALWMGLPVLTATGATFAGRVATSLLAAAGLPELAMPSLDAYEDEAVRLARDPAALGAIKMRLAANRTRCPLFD